MFISVRLCAEVMTQLCRVKVKIKKSCDLALNLVAALLSLLPLEGLSLNLSQMFISARQCTELLTQLCRLKVKVKVKGNGMNKP